MHLFPCGVHFLEWVSMNECAPPETNIMAAPLKLGYRLSYWGPCQDAVPALTIRSPGTRVGSLMELATGVHWMDSLPVLRDGS